MPRQPPSAIVEDVWRRMNKEWLWVYRGAPARADVWSPEILVPAGVFFVERGHVKIEADGSSIEVPAGHAFFSAPGLRRQLLSGGSALLSAAFRCSWLDGTPLFCLGLNRAVKTARVANLFRATKDLFATVHASAREVSYLDALRPVSRSPTGWCQYEAAFLRWLAIFGETAQDLGIAMVVPQDANEKLAAKILASINGASLQEAHPMRAQAGKLGIGMRRIDQVLTERYGLTSRAMQERRRLEAARARLQEATMPLKAIAGELGFRHASHFTAWFKRHHGISPSLFRQSANYGAA